MITIHRFIAAGVLVSLTVLIGCNDPVKTIEVKPIVVPSQAPSDASSAVSRRPDIDPSLFKSDIYKVVCAFPPNMWKSFDAAGDSNPEGFAFVLYLLSRSTNKGAFADGMIRVEVFTITRSADQPTTRTLAQTWDVATHELPHRAPTLLGSSYQPALYWADADVYGRELDIVVQYISPEGDVVPAQTKHARVPPRRI